MSVEDVQARVRELVQREGGGVDCASLLYDKDKIDQLAYNVACLHNGDGVTALPHASLARPDTRAAYIFVGAASSDGMPDAVLPDVATLLAQLRSRLSPCPQLVPYPVTVDGRAAVLIEIVVAYSQAPARLYSRDSRVRKKRPSRSGSSNADATDETWSKILARFSQRVADSLTRQLQANHVAGDAALRVLFTDAKNPSDVAWLASMQWHAVAWLSSSDPAPLMDAMESCGARVEPPLDLVSLGSNEKAAAMASLPSALDRVADGDVCLLLHGGQTPGSAHGALYGFKTVRSELQRRIDPTSAHVSLTVVALEHLAPPLSGAEASAQGTASTVLAELLTQPFFGLGAVATTSPLVTVALSAPAERLHQLVAEKLASSFALPLKQFACPSAQAALPQLADVLSRTASHVKLAGGGVLSVSEHGSLPQALRLYQPAKGGPPLDQLQLDFLAGGELTPEQVQGEAYSAQAGVLVQRAVLPALREAVVCALRERRAAYVVLEHAPVAGASTLARLVASENAMLKHATPVVIKALPTGNSVARRNLIAAIQLLAERSAHVLAVVDAPAVDCAQVQAFIAGSVLEDMAQLAFVVVQRQQQRTVPANATRLCITLGPRLQPKETVDFKRVYRVGFQLHNREGSKGDDCDGRNAAFPWGAALFAREFGVMADYLSLHASQLDDADKRLLLLVAAVSFLTRDGVPVSVAAAVLGIDDCGWAAAHTARPALFALLREAGRSLHAPVHAPEVCTLLAAAAKGASIDASTAGRWNPEWLIEALLLWLDQRRQYHELAPVQAVSRAIFSEEPRSKMTQIIGGRRAIELYDKALEVPKADDAPFLLANRARLKQNAGDFNAAMMDMDAAVAQSCERLERAQSHGCVSDSLVRMHSTILDYKAGCAVAQMERLVAVEPQDEERIRALLKETSAVLDASFVRDRKMYNSYAAVMGVSLALAVRACSSLANDARELAYRWLYELRASVEENAVVDIGGAALILRTQEARVAQAFGGAQTWPELHAALQNVKNGSSSPSDMLALARSVELIDAGDYCHENVQKATVLFEALLHFGRAEKQTATPLHLQHLLLAAVHCDHNMLVADLLTDPGYLWLSSRTSSLLLGGLRRQWLMACRVLRGHAVASAERAAGEGCWYFQRASGSASVRDVMPRRPAKLIRGEVVYNMGQCHAEASLFGRVQRMEIKNEDLPAALRLATSNADVVMHVQVHGGVLRATNVQQWPVAECGVLDS